MWSIAAENRDLQIQVLVRSHLGVDTEGLRPEIRKQRRMKVAVELHGEGFTQVAIAQRLGCTPDRVAQLLREAGVPPRKYSKGAA